MTKKPKISQAETDSLRIDLERLSPIPGKLSFKCKNQKQKEFLETMKENEIIFVTGPAGSGKSYESLYHALKLVQEPGNGYNKIVLIYPVEIDSSEQIGFIKGTVADKLEPFYSIDFYTMSKIFNASGCKNGEEVVKKLYESGVIEIRPAGFLRGSTLDNSVVVISEAQNFGKDTLLKILTRIGENSKYIFNADESQLDADSLKKNKKVPGLRYAIEKLGGIPGIGFCEFGINDVVRNPLITKILKSWDPDRYKDLGE